MKESLIGLLVMLAATTAQARAPMPFIDGDGDGIADEVDECLYSPAGAKVDARGCSNESDEDEDGVSDSIDDCPYSPPAALVNAKGCALDEDYDGVADGIDLCPRSELGAVADFSGCVAGQIRIAAVSRPAAGAAASVRQPVSKPQPGDDVAAVVAVAAEPTRPAAVSNGPVSSGRQDALFSTLYFSPGSQELNAQTQAKLDRAVKDLIERLNRQPELNLLIVGHSTTGADPVLADNLSAARANRVKSFLIRAGIPNGRVVSQARADREPRYQGDENRLNARAELLLLESSRSAAAAGSHSVTASE